jgi:hypothetical protein
MYKIYVQHQQSPVDICSAQPLALSVGTRGCLVEFVCQSWDERKSYESCSSRGFKYSESRPHSARQSATRKQMNHVVVTAVSMKITVI